MSDLRAAISKLAHDVPAMRKHLVPILRSHTATEFDSEEALQKYLKEHPDADRAKHTVKKPYEPPQSLKEPQPHESKRKNLQQLVNHHENELGKHTDKLKEIAADPSKAKGKEWQGTGKGDELAEVDHKDRAEKGKKFHQEHLNEAKKKLKEHDEG